jgi:hypothetical protein
MANAPTPITAPAPKLSLWSRVVAWFHNPEEVRSAIEAAETFINDLDARITNLETLAGIVSAAVPAAAPAAPILAAAEAVGQVAESALKLADNAAGATAPTPDIATMQGQVSALLASIHAAQVATAPASK